MNFNLDFTLTKYNQFIQTLKECGYFFLTFEQYCSDKPNLAENRYAILRHDVDLRASHSLVTAKMEHKLEIDASYYFRVVPQSNVPEIIKAIADMGHEIGYHYEDMTLCEGDTEKAIEHFKQQLNYFRRFYPVKTICMHGSPRSRFDGRDLWKHYDYHDFGIAGEPYFDVDFSKVFYLTDTGRRWDGFNVSVRDKIPVYQDEWVEKGLVYHSTDDIIAAADAGNLPKQMMITTHPQRWTDKEVDWLVEFVSQSAKNVVKKILVRKG